MTADTSHKCRTPKPLSHRNHQTHSELNEEFNVLRTDRTWNTQEEALLQRRLLCVADGPTLPRQTGLELGPVPLNIQSIDTFRDCRGIVVTGGGYRKYSTETLNVAIQRVLQGESVRSVSIELQLPRETLRTHAKKAREKGAAWTSASEDA